jgi:hypothetical protein
MGNETFRLDFKHQTPRETSSRLSVGETTVDVEAVLGTQTIATNRVIEVIGNVSFRPYSPASPSSPRKSSKNPKPVCWLPSTQFPEEKRPPWQVKKDVNQRAQMSRAKSKSKIIVPPIQQIVIQYMPHVTSQMHLETEDSELEDSIQVQESVGTPVDTTFVKSTIDLAEIVQESPAIVSEEQPIPEMGTGSTPDIPASDGPVTSTLKRSNSSPRVGNTPRRRRNTVRGLKRIRVTWNNREIYVTPTVSDMELQSHFQFDNQAMMYLFIVGLKDKTSEELFPLAQDPQFPLVRRIEAENAKKMVNGGEYELITEDTRAAQVSTLVETEIDMLRSQFDAMDVTKTGELSRTDILTFYQEQSTEILRVFGKLKIAKSEIYTSEEEIREIEQNFMAHEEHVQKFVQFKVDGMMHRDINNRGTITWEEFLNSEARHVIRVRRQEDVN